MKHFSLFALLFLPMTVFAQLTASKAFINAPQQVFPLLDQTVRMDMVDYFESGMSTPSTNAFNGASAITSLTPDLVVLKSTDSSTAQLGLLTQSNDTVIALVTTLATPGLDSNIRFFKSDWTPLPSKFARPEIKDWLNKQGKANQGEVEAQVPFMLASYELNPSEGTLTVTNNLQAFFDPDIYSMIEPFLIKSLIYKWNGKEFKKID